MISKLFDPIATFSAGVETDEVVPVKIAYNFEENIRRNLSDRGSILAPYSSGDDELDEMAQEVQDISALFPSPQELDEYISKIEHSNEISRDDILAIESKWPGLIVNSGISLESYTVVPSRVNLTATVEAMASVQTIAVVVALVGGIIKLLMWIGKSGTRKYDGDIESMRNGDSSAADFAKRVAEAREQFGDIFGNYKGETVKQLGGAKLSEVIAIVKNDVDMGKLFLAANKGIVHRAATAPILKNGDLLKKTIVGVGKALEAHGKEVSDFLSEAAKNLQSEVMKDLQVEEDYGGSSGTVRTPSIIKALPKAPDNFIKAVSAALDVGVTSETLYEVTIPKFEPQAMKGVLDALTMKDAVKDGDKLKDTDLKVLDDVPGLIDICLEFQEASKGMSKTIDREKIVEGLTKLVKDLRVFGKKAGADAAKKAKGLKDGAKKFLDETDPDAKAEAAAQESRSFDFGLEGFDGVMPAPTHTKDGREIKTEAGPLYRSAKTLGELNDQIQQLNSKTEAMVHAILTFYSGIAELMKLANGGKDGAYQKAVDEAEAEAKGEKPAEPAKQPAQQ